MDDRDPPRPSPSVEQPTELFGRKMTEYFQAIAAEGDINAPAEPLDAALGLAPPEPEPPAPQPPPPLARATAPQPLASPAEEPRSKLPLLLGALVLVLLVAGAAVTLLVR